MSQAIELLNRGGEWIVRHSLIPYPVLSTVVLALGCLALYGHAFYRLAQVKRRARSARMRETISNA